MVSYKKNAVIPAWVRETLSIPHRQNNTTLKQDKIKQTNKNTKPQNKDCPSLNKFLWWQGSLMGFF